MNEQDRQAIEGLFSRLAEAERQAAAKDAEADAYIKRQIDQQPGAPYMMAQTIVVQNYALEQAQQRIQELEAQTAQTAAPANGGSGRFGGLFGGGKPAASAPRMGSVPASGSPMGAPPAGHMPQPQPQQSGGGGFLAGAAQTAVGVAGGVLLGNAIGGMFGGDTAQAAPAAAAADPAAAQPAAEPAPAPEPAPEPEPVSDEGGGGWFDSIFGGGDHDMEL